jgi:hypothetical protein
MQLVLVLIWSTMVLSIKNRYKSNPMGHAFIISVGRLLEFAMSYTWDMGDFGTFPKWG